MCRCIRAGNLLVLRDGRLGFIDFGIVGKMSPVTFQALEAFLMSTMAADYVTMARALITMGVTQEAVVVEVRPVFMDMPGQYHTQPLDSVCQIITAAQLHSEAAQQCMNRLLCDMFWNIDQAWTCGLHQSVALMQDFAADLRKLFAEADALDMGPLMQPGVDPQAAAASMASDARVNNLLLQVRLIADTHMCNASSVGRGSHSGILFRLFGLTCLASCSDWHLLLPQYASR